MNLKKILLIIAVTLATIILIFQVINIKQGDVYANLVKTIEEKNDFLSDVASEEKGLLQSISKNIELEKKESKRTDFKEAYEIIELYNINQKGKSLGSLTLKQLILNNGDYYYFVQFLPQVDEKDPINLSIPILLDDYEYRYITYPEGFNERTSKWSDLLKGNTKTKLPKDSLFIDSSIGSYFFSYVDVFEKQDNEVKKEIYDLAKEINISKKGIVLLLPSKKNHIVEQWGILSNDILVDWEDTSAPEDLKIGDLNRVRKWGINGIYYVTPESYYPTSDRSFWMNPAHHIGEKFLRTPGGKFFESFAITSLYTAVKTQNEYGFWSSTPRSEWLYNDYGIKEDFYDTRFNTDVVLFLLRGYDKYKDPVFLDTVVKHAEFFMDFAENNNFKTENGGYLIWDYGNKLIDNPPNHVSLNHLVTEMNFLYELYKITDDNKYYDLAQKIKIAVKDTAPNWKKEEDGDLWYAYLIDHTYGLQDYPHLTLKDLRYSQKLFKEVDGEIDPDFEYLIKVKEEYLTSKGLPLY